MRCVRDDDETTKSSGHRHQSQAVLFRLGRHAMGWSEAALARTIAVPEQTVRHRVSGARPIPPKVGAWVGVYARDATLLLVEQTDDGPVQGYAV